MTTPKTKSSVIKVGDVIEFVTQGRKWYARVDKIVPEQLGNPGYVAVYDSDGNWFHVSPHILVKKD